MRIHPYIILTSAMLFFSGNFIVGKAFEGVIPPFTLALFRVVAASIFLLPLCYKTLRLNHSLWKKEWKPLLGISLTGVVLFNVALYSAVNYTSSINAAIVDALTPAVAAILGFILLRETLNKIQLGGIILSFGGILWIITEGSFAVIRSLSFNIGDIIMLFGIVCWAIYSIIIKKHSYKFPNIAGLVMTMIIGAIILFPLALYEWITYGFPSLFDWNTILGIMYIGLFPSAIALLAWYKGVAEIGPAKASVFFNLVPVFTTVLAITFLGEVFTYHHLFGGIIVLIGVYLSTGMKSRQRQKQIQFKKEA
ncbi:MULTISPECIES: DMT family transporter [Bacillaceae]|uniref:DMT family transporter n=1 Tax=Evansella alkalicola TaxID=745819 RepID=A0ABS6JUM1_9BACI|nr:MULTISPECIES: DMT family transporter [Bacillaceae]MBU9720825.1 DMT family transporter [Bacillus alkalicola]